MSDSDRIRELENAYVEVSAILEWVEAALTGREVSEFAESFPIVRLAMDTYSSVMAVEEKR